MTTTPAAQLKQAADKLRQLATAAAHGDRTRWEVGHTLGSKSRVVVDNHETPTVLIETWAKHREQVDDYLAAFASPVVALAVAELLTTEAAVAEDMQRQSPDMTAEQLAAWVDGPLAIARAILGEVTR